MAPDLKDKIVEFLADDRLLFGLVTDQGIDKLHVTDANGRNRRVPVRSVLIVHPGRVPLADFAAALPTLRDRIQSLCSEVDTELLWEATQSRKGTLEPGYLAREYFGEEDPCRQSAVLRAVLNDPLRFRLRGNEIYSRSGDQVEQQLHQRQLEQAREDRWNAISDWLQRSLTEPGKVAASSGDFPELLDELEEFLFCRNGEPPSWLTEGEPEIWKRTPIVKELAPREAAFQLLIGAGRLPHDADPLLVIAGIDPNFSPAALQAASLLEPYAHDSSRPDFTPLDPIAIDDEDTAEVDDAITLEKIPAGHRIGIHIADVAHFMDRAGNLLEEARSRVSSVYLPHRRLTMLPERLSCDLASLQPGQLRPVVSTLIDVDKQGEILDFQICRGQLRLKHRLDYETADEQLQQGSDATLNWLSWFCDRRRRWRFEQGAVTFHTPEFKIKVAEDDTITVTQLDSRSPARQLVAELMILANSLVARYARQEAVSVVYRGQRPPKKEVKIPAEYDPLALQEIFRSLERSRYGLEPAPHAGLGVEAYSQVTSPIRRLVDLLSQVQLVAHLDIKAAVFEASEMSSILRKVGDTERNLRAVERRAIRHYLLKFVERHCRGNTFEAIVLGPADRGFEIETVEYTLRGRLLGGNVRRKPGERLEVKVESIDLEQSQLSFRPAV